MEDSKENLANPMENINIEENPVSKMENIDTDKNLVSNKENFESKKIPSSRMQIDSKNNISNFTENIDNYLNILERYNIEDTIEDDDCSLFDDSKAIMGIINLISSQKKNIEILLQIIESSLKLIDSTSNCCSSSRESSVSHNPELLFKILSYLQKFIEKFEVYKSYLSDVQDLLQFLDASMKSRLKNSESPIPIQAVQLMYILEKAEIDTLEALNILEVLTRTCKLILDDDPSIMRWFNTIDIGSF